MTAAEALQEITDGTKLMRAIQAGLIPTDSGSGACFEGKEITADTKYHESHPRAGQPFAGSRFRIGIFAIANRMPDEWKHRPVTATGRKCWAWAGRGSCFEVVDDEGQVAWVSHLEIVP